MEFITEYGMFLAKFMTIVLGLVIIAAGIFLFIMRARAGGEEHLDIKNLNQKYETMSLILNSQVLPKKEFKKVMKERKQEHKQKEKIHGDAKRKRIFVLDFRGDIKASDVSSLREEITALLTIADEQDEVVVKIESAGGTVHGYGLAASQLRRIRDKGIFLTVAVDKVAASGGYMMACVANRIIAGPFAILGSIGVLAQIPNFHRLLKKFDIDFEQLSAGKFKRSLTLFGENTDRDREKLQEELEDTHNLFKEFVKENRGQVDIDMIATGEHWHGKRALEFKLVDELRTSDDYLCDAAQKADVFEIRYERRKPLTEKIISFGIQLFDKIA
ncbi:MAG: protease SohB [Gammaproteobacteria bacterium RBG_16_51_14]|nr:MAG: protease SohB [Gammaproteobacteria bacterium RBG_16_51_14]